MSKGNGISNKNISVIQSCSFDHCPQLNFLDLNNCQQEKVVCMNTTMTFVLIFY